MILDAYSPHACRIKSQLRLRKPSVRLEADVLFDRLITQTSSASCGNFPQQQPPRSSNVKEGQMMLLLIIPAISLCQRTQFLAGSC